MIAGVLEIQIMAGLARISEDMRKAERIVGDSMAKVEKSARNARSAMETLTVGFGAMVALQQIKQMSDSYTKLDAQLRLSTKNQREYNQALVDVQRISTVAQTNIGATTMLYTRMMNVTRGMNVEQSKIATVAETVSYGLKAYGATAAEASSASLQLSQAMGANRLGGEEFRAVMEAMPNVMKVLADSMGVPLGQLRQLSIDGKITTEVMLKAFSDPAIAAAMRRAAEQTRTIGGELVVMSNNAMQFVGSLLKLSGAQGGAIGAISLLSEALKLAVTYVAQITSLLLTLAAVYAGKYVAGLVQARMATVAMTKAGVEILAATVAQEKAYVASIATTMAANRVSIVAATAKLAEADAIGVLTVAHYNETRAAESKIAAGLTERVAAVQRLAMIGKEAAAVNATIASKGAAISNALVAERAAVLERRAIAKIELAQIDASIAGYKVQAAANVQAQGQMTAAMAQRTAMQARLIALEEAQVIANGQVAASSASLAAAEAHHAQATMSWMTKLRAFAAANMLGLIGLALWGIYTVADQLGWIDKLSNKLGDFFNTQESHIRRLKDLAGGGVSGDAMGRAIETVAQRAAAQAAADAQSKMLSEAGITGPVGAGNVTAYINKLTAELEALDEKRKRWKNSEYGTRETENITRALDILREYRLEMAKVLKPMDGTYAFGSAWLAMVDKHTTAAEKKASELAGINAAYNSEMVKLQHATYEGPMRAKLQSELDAARSRMIADINKPDGAGSRAVPGMSMMGKMAEDMAAKNIRDTSAMTNAQKVAAAWKEANDNIEAARSNKATERQIADMLLKRGTEVELANAKRDAAAATADLDAKHSVDRIKDIDKIIAAQQRAHDIRSMDATEIAKYDDAALIAEQERLRHLLKQTDSLELQAQLLREITRIGVQRKTAEQAAIDAEQAAQHKVVEGYAVMFTGAIVTGLKNGEGAAASLAKVLGQQVEKEMSAAMAKVATSSITGDKKSSTGDWVMAIVGIVAAISTAARNTATAAEISKVTASEVQKLQGTGSILGDALAQSHSISNSLSMIHSSTLLTSKYSVTMIEHLQSIDRDMHTFVTAAAVALGGDIAATMGIKRDEKYSSDASMFNQRAADWFGVNSPVVSNFIKSIEDAVGGTHTSTVTDTGIIISGAIKDLAAGLGVGTYASGTNVNSGLFGTGIGGSSSTWTQYGAASAGLAESIAGVYAGISDTFKTMALKMGMDISNVDDTVDNFVTTIGKLSLEGLNAEEKVKALAAAMSKDSDLLAEQLFPALMKFRTAGEGMFETVVRINLEIENADAFFKMLGRDITSTAESADALSNALGGVDSAAKKMRSFIDTFAPVEVAVTNSKDALRALGFANLDNMTTTEAWWKLMQDANDAELEAILNNQPAIEAYIAAMDKQRAATEAAAAALQAETDAKLKAAQVAYGGVVSAIDALRAAGVAVRNLIASIGAGSASTNELRQRFMVTNALAASGDVAAQGKLGESANAYLASAKTNAESAQDMARATAYVQGSLNITAMALEGVVSTAEAFQSATLAAAQESNDILASIAAEAVSAQNKAQLAYAAALDAAEVTRDAVAATAEYAATGLEYDAGLVQIAKDAYDLAQAAADQAAADAEYLLSSYEYVSADAQAAAYAQAAAAADQAAIANDAYITAKSTYDLLMEDAVAQAEAAVQADTIAQATADLSSAALAAATLAAIEAQADADTANAWLTTVAANTANTATLAAAQESNDILASIAAEAVSAQNKAQRAYAAALDAAEVTRDAVAATAEYAATGLEYDAGLVQIAKDAYDLAQATADQAAAYAAYLSSSYGYVSAQAKAAADAQAAAAADQAAIANDAYMTAKSTYDLLMEDAVAQAEAAVQADTIAQAAADQAAAALDVATLAAIEAQADADTANAWLTTVAANTANTSNNIAALSDAMNLLLPAMVDADIAISDAMVLAIDDFNGAVSNAYVQLSDAILAGYGNIVDALVSSRVTPPVVTPPTKGLPIVTPPSIMPILKIVADPTAAEKNKAAALKVMNDAYAALQIANATRDIMKMMAANVTYISAKGKYDSLPAYAVGSNYIDRDQIAQIHAGEEITPRPYVDLQRTARDETNALLARLVNSNAELRNELVQLRAESRHENNALVRTAQRTERILDKWDHNGMPEVTTI